MYQNVFDTRPKTNIFDQKTTGNVFDAPTSRSKAKPPDALQSFVKGSADLASKPIGVLNAVFGAPERAVQSFIGADPTKMGANFTDPFYAVFHPNDEQWQQQHLNRIESVVGADKLTGLAKAGVDFGVQTLLDPLTYVPFLGEGKLATRASAALGDLAKTKYAALPAPVLSWSQRHVEPVVNFFRSNPQIAQAFGGDKEAINVYKGVYETEKAKQIPQLRENALLLDRYKPQLEAGIMPPEIRSVLTDAITGDARTTVEMPSSGSLFNAVAQRFQLKAAFDFEKAVNARMLDELGMSNPKGYEKFKQLPGELDVERARLNQKPNALQGLTNLSDAYRAALFINPLPHMFNIARLAYFAGGARPVARGLGYFAKGIPEELGKRVDQFVGRPEYLGGARTAGEQAINKMPLLGPATSKMRDVGQTALSKFDAAMRASYLEELEQGVAATGQRGYNLGQEVREGIGEYGQPSGLVRGLRSIGAPFPAWRLGIVPKAIARTAARNPERLARYGRAAADVQQNTGVEFGGPAEDFGKLADVPVGSARYLESTAPLLAFLAASATGKGPNAKTAAEELGRDYIPGAGQLEELTGLSPYSKEGQNRLLNLLLSLFGGYTK